MAETFDILYYCVVLRPCYDHKTSNKHTPLHFAVMNGALPLPLSVGATLGVVAASLLVGFWGCLYCAPCQLVNGQ